MARSSIFRALEPAAGRGRGKSRSRKSRSRKSRSRKSRSRKSRSRSR